MTLSLLWLDLVVFLIIAISHAIKFTKLWKQGIKIKQLKLFTYGLRLIFVGVLIGIGLPRILGIRYDVSINAQKIYLVIFTLSVIVFFIGLRFFAAAYKYEEETPVWIKGVMKLWR